jgi:hypothetical protein
LIPEIAIEHEEVYQKFLRGKLVYKPNKDNNEGMKEFRISDLANPLSGTFDIRGCGDSDKYLSISTGFRTEKNPANEEKVEVWIVPQFVLQKDSRSKLYNDFLQAQKTHRGKPFAVLFNLGGWKSDNYDHGVTGVVGSELDSLASRAYTRRSSWYPGIPDPDFRGSYLVYRPDPFDRIFFRMRALDEFFYINE